MASQQLLDKDTQADFDEFVSQGKFRTGFKIVNGQSAALLAITHILKENGKDRESLDSSLPKGTRDMPVLEDKFFQEMSNVISTDGKEGDTTYLAELYKTFESATDGNMEIVRELLLYACPQLGMFNIENDYEAEYVWNHFKRWNDEKGSFSPEEVAPIEAYFVDDDVEFDPLPIIARMASITTGLDVTAKDSQLLLCFMYDLMFFSLGSYCVKNIIAKDETLEGDDSESTSSSNSMSSMLEAFFKLNSIVDKIVAGESVEIDEDEGEVLDLITATDLPSALGIAITARDSASEATESVIPSDVIPTTSESVVVHIESSSEKDGKSSP